MMDKRITAHLREKALLKGQFVEGPIRDAMLADLDKKIEAIWNEKQGELPLVGGGAKEAPKK